ncbi:MAG: DEAD/DEAH box helicase [Limnochordia bacterium]|jgi:SNF2 family DNA or RNA helicase
MAGEVRFSGDGDGIITSLCREEYDSFQWFKIQRQARELSLHKGFTRLLALDALPQLELYPHQRQTVLKVLRHMRGRAILADEVGLGKTIEAGTILKEYLLRGLVRRALVLTPASLVQQWYGELTDKFQLPVQIGRAVDHWQQGQILLASLDTAKRPHNAEVIHQILWDLVIVDEAHRLKNKATANYRFVDALPKKFLLLLTATPLQNHLGELYNLVNLLQPGQLATYSQFKKTFTFDRHSPRNTQRLRLLLDDVLVRTTRKGALLAFPRRKVALEAVTLSGEERQFYQQALQDLRRIYKKEGERPQHILSLILILREICSSSPAAARTLQIMAQRGRFSPQACGAFGELAQLANQIQRYAKVDKLIDFIRSHPGEQIIVFTAFRATQRLLEEKLEEAGLCPILFHGGLTGEEKEEAMDTFRGRGRVLISTEAGGEGRNLQFCRLLVNYDLPWNPMRLEQRLGRIDRLGQEKPMKIVNLIARDTIEEHILYLLDKKLQMFSKVIGELEPLLGPWEGGSWEIKLGKLFLGYQGRELQGQIREMGAHIDASLAQLDKVVGLNRRLLDGEVE